MYSRGLKTFSYNKKTSTVGLEPGWLLYALRVNGCLHLRLLGTPADERWVLWACKNKLCDLQRHSFHFEQVPFQSVLTRPSYQRAKNADRQTDGQTDGFSALYSRLIRLITHIHTVCT